LNFVIITSAVLGLIRRTGRPRDAEEPVRVSNNAVKKVTYSWYTNTYIK